MTFVAKLTSEEIARLEDAVRGGGFDLRMVPHARFSARGEGVTCTLYESGKCVVQGRGMEQFIDHHLPGHAKPGEVDPSILEFEGTIVGSDESGKGDYFGPLVTAAVAFSPEHLPLLEETRITDSKAMRPDAIRRSAGLIRESLPHEIVVVGPEKYNQLYAKIGNLNRLLAWCHGAALEAVLGRCDADTVIVDKFCEEPVLRRGLKPLAASKRLVLRTRAESHPAVAAASVLASDAFTRALAKLGREVDLTLPKGASSAVEAAARRLVQVRGREVLRRVAKLHFKTTERV